MSSKSSQENSAGLIQVYNMLYTSCQSQNGVNLPVPEVSPYNLSTANLLSEAMKARSLE